MALTFPTPSLPTVRFDSGNEARIFIESLDTYDETVGLVEADEVPVVAGDISFTPSGSVESIPIYGEVWDRAVKNGLSGTFNVTTHAPSSNAVVSQLLAAAQGVGQAAGIAYAFLLPDGGWLSGAAVVNDFVPNTPVRGVSSYTFNMTTDGEVDFTAATA
jgi:hypothetical protein